MNADTGAGVSGNATMDDAEDASDTEVVRYEKAFLATRRTLDECIRNLMIMEAGETDPDRLDELAEKRMEIETDRNDLVAANVAFHASQTTMVPPSPVLVTQITALSQAAVELTSQKATATAILKLATSTLTKFSEIQKIGGG
jgi:hypothetical protein